MEDGIMGLRALITLNTTDNQKTLNWKVVCCAFKKSHIDRHKLVWCKILKKITSLHKNNLVFTELMVN